MQKFTFYKGDEGVPSIQKEFDPLTTLQEVRNELKKDGFLTPKEDSDYRFINYRNQGLSYEDMVVGVGIEQFAPVAKMTGMKDQVYLTNVNKSKEVDLLGFNTNMFFNRYMSCSVVLNPSASTENSGKNSPLMLTNVKVANPKLRGVGAMDNVVICEEGSLIAFNINSWGAAGFGKSITPQAGPPIVDENWPLYSTFGDCPAKGNYGRGQNPAYFSQDAKLNQSMIKVVSAKSAKMNIGGSSNATVLNYMKYTVKTWIVSSYKRGGKTFTCNKSLPYSDSIGRSTGEADVPPFKQLHGAQTVIPGSTIEPGSTVPTTDKNKDYLGGSVSDIKEDKSPTGTIGEVVFYMFMFKSHAEAEKVFGKINDIDPNVWSS